MAKSDLDFLGSIPLFQGLSKKELRTVLKQSEEERFASGREIVTAGDPGGRFFVITSGRAGVFVGGSKKKSLGAGDFFGEMAILDRRRRGATVKAETEVRARTITSWNFLSLLEENWPMTKKVLLALTERIRDMEESLTH